MNEGQSKLYSMFKEVKQICEEHNIRYYVAGGTLIGALRHRGFVPWDDDLDLYMTRDEFRKFAQVARDGGFPAGRKAECQELSRDYRNIFCRYTDETTCCIHKHQLTSSEDAGEVLDILQLDPVPSDPKEQRKYLELLALYGDLINETAVYSNRYESGQSKYLYYKELADKIGKDAVLSQMEEELFSYPEEECEYYIMRLPGQPLVLKKSLFEPALQAKFEDTTVTIPRQFNQYLIDHYGDDWMYIPKVDTQMSHEAVRSFTHNYQMIRDVYQGDIDMEDIQKSAVERKISMIDHSVENHIVADKMVALRGENVAITLLKKLENIDVFALYESHNYKKLRSVFNLYYTRQNHPQFSGRDTFKFYYRFLNPILIELPTDIMRIALLVENDIGKTGKAYRTLEIYEHVKGSLPKELEQLREQILMQRDAMNAFTLGEVDYCYDKIRKVLEMDPYSMIAIKILIACLQKKGGASDEIAGLIKRGKKIDPEDGELMKYEADLIYKESPEKACEKYLCALGKTAHGFVKLDVEEKIEKYAERLGNNVLDELRKGNYFEAKKILAKMQAYREKPEVVSEYISTLLRVDLDPELETLYDLYNRLLLLKGKIKEQSLKKLLEKALVLNEVTPVVANCWMEMFFAENQMAGDELRLRLSEEINKYSQCGCDRISGELQKLMGDSYLADMQLIEAYECYRNAYVHLADNSLIKNDLEKRFREDLTVMEEMKQAGVSQEDISVNVKAKFGDENFMELLKEKIKAD